MFSYRRLAKVEKFMPAGALIRKEAAEMIQTDWDVRNGKAAVSGLFQSPRPATHAVWAVLKAGETV